MSEDKKAKKRRSKLGVSGKKAIAGVRRIVKSGDSYYVALPKEFMERHGLTAGDELPYVGNHILKFVPVQELSDYEFWETRKRRMEEDEKDMSEA